MPKIARNLLIALTSGLLPTGLAAEESATLATPSSKVTLASSSSIKLDLEATITMLDSPKYVEREKAQKELIAAGAAVIEPLKKAAATGSLEQSTRAVAILSQLALSSDSATGVTSAQALEELVESKQAKPLNLARSLLDEQRRKLQPRVLEELQRLGGQYSRVHNPQTGQMTAIHVTLDENWTGGDSNIALLKQLPDLSAVTLQGGNVSDAAVPQLKLLTSLTSLQVFGTKLSDTGYAELQASLTSTQLSRRTGAYLGVGGFSGAGFAMAGCTITSVLDGSAAAEAELRVQDVIIQFGDTRVENFEQLQKLVGERQPGEEIKVEVLRGGEQISKTVKLKAWK